MAHDASEILGAPQVAGVKVNPLGLGKAIAGRSGGAGAGGGAAGLVAIGILNAIGMKSAKKAKEAAADSSAPDFGRLAFLAVTDDELALVELKQNGAVGLRLEGVIERVPLNRVRSATLGRAGLYSPPLTVEFTDGSTWRLEVPLPSKKQAKQVVSALESN
ncbi:MAG TPA: hypothetical protein VHX66_10065 [Solirubrobacteraceae bacterium]|jgi:hypothetical protein|nr:hypothetical protein [Solirubrobacteraceae bacterium]